jgi:putative ABC transport system permease protein
MSAPAGGPPRLAQLLLRCCPLGERREEVETDLRELFAIRLVDAGYSCARWRYLADVVSLFQFRSSIAVPSPRHLAGGSRQMVHDLRFAARLLRRQPGLFGATVAGLAVAIGISTAVFSIMHAALFGDYGIAAPETVMRVAFTGAGRSPITGDSGTWGNWAFSDYVQLREAASSLEVVAAARWTSDYRASATDGAPFRVTVAAVSGNYFPVLGLQASRGRTLAVADDVPGQALAVVSHGFWKNRLGADPAIVGRTIWLGEQPFTLIGVADRAHSAPPSAGSPPAFWITLASLADLATGDAATRAADTRARLDALKANGAADAAERERLRALERDLVNPARRWNPAVDVFGRTRPGVTRAQAEAEVGVIAMGLPGAGNGGPAASRPTVALAPVDATVGFVVFLACANVTNLLLASAATRRREIGVRLAIGASPGRIVRQLLTESLLLGTIGGVFGLLIATGIMPAFAALVEVPPTFDVSPDLTVYGFVALLILAVGLIAGMAPARYGGRGDLVAALTSDQLAAPRPLPRGTLRSLLIGGQAAASVVLLVLAALLTRSLVHSTQADLGYDPSRIVSVSIGRGPGRALQPEAYWTAVVERARQLPGVEGAALAVASPFSGLSPQLLEGRRVSRNETSPEYFETMGVRLIKGRTYTADEVRQQAPVAMISERLAREAWGDDDPIGASLDQVWGRSDAPGKATPGPYRKPPGTRIVGVVSEVVNELNTQETPTIYLPLAPTSVAQMVLRTRDDPRGLLPALHGAVQAADPSHRPTTLFAADGLQRELQRPAMLALLAALVGATALGLAVIGLFGVTAFVVEQRRHEVSVRQALGATNRDITTMLFRDSLTPVAAGLAFGTPLALLGGRVVQGVLYGVSSRDPLAILVAVAVLVSATAAAILVPVRRASRVSSAQLLKQG